MIKIDGSQGGGQMLRSALGLSAVTGKAFQMINIRGSRPKPGLKIQHLEGTRAVAQICNAEVLGLNLGSKELIFKPQEIKSGKIKIKVGTAGSVGLILQAVLIPATQTKIKILIEGGATYGKWCVPMDSLWNIVFPLLSRMGYDIKVKNVKQGFYPKGGTRVEVVSKKAELKPIEIMDKGKLLALKGISVASSSLKRSKVAERQIKAAKHIIFSSFNKNINILNLYSETLCPGSGITLWAECENSIIGADCLGEKGKRAEIVGAEAAQKLIIEYENAAVDAFTADQLMVYMALAKGGKIKTSKITEHMKTNAKIIEKFLNVKFKLDNNIIECCNAKVP
ncbi:MAG: RNA 3'-terminal phosphate cyclase [Nanoarchaeota archaeon]|nr:RNA 3'-terminal phosphate cyclase [Nanoarchaeota archaeon]